MKLTRDYAKDRYFWGASRWIQVSLSFVTLLRAIKNLFEIRQTSRQRQKECIKVIATFSHIFMEITMRYVENHLHKYFKFAFASICLVWSTFSCRLSAFFGSHTFSFIFIVFLMCLSEFQKFYVVFLLYVVKLSCIRLEIESKGRWIFKTIFLFWIFFLLRGRHIQCIALISTFHTK